MIEWLNNPWVIGIVGGLIVTAISRYLFSRRDNKEYRQKVVTANQEILYAVRPGVSEGKIASVEVLDSLLTATASKYGVEKDDLYRPSEISNHLIKEVMDSSFISVELKQQYCDALAALKVTRIQKEKGELQQPEREKPEAATISEYREKLVTMLSMMLGIITTIMTVLVVFLDKIKIGLDKDISVVMPTIAAMVAILVSTLMMQLFKILKDKEVKRRSKSKGIESDEESKS